MSTNKRKTIHGTKVDALDKKREEFLKDIFGTFFSKKEMAEFSARLLNAKKPSPKGSSVSRIQKEQINIELDGFFKLQSQMDLLITYAETKLDKFKFLELLLLLGHFTITSGELASAVYIHEKILKETRGKKEFNNLTGSALLALGEVFSRQALWEVSFNYIKEAYALYKKDNDYKGCANCENLLGTIYGDFGNLKKAGAHLEKSLEFLEHDNDVALKGKTEINLGVIKNIMGDLDGALTYYRRALINFEKINDLKRIAEIHHNMGMMFTKKEEYKSAIQSFDRSIVASNKTGYLPSLGISYLSKAYVYTKLNDLMLAEAYSEKALEICHKTNDMLSIADIYKIKGIIQRSLRHYDAAENYLLTSLRINKELSNELNYAESANELGVLYQQMDKPNESKANFTAALSYYKKIKAQREIEDLQQKIKAL